MQSSLLAQNFASGQTEQQPSPQALTAAATIAPLTNLVIVTGTTALATITPPLPGIHVIYVVAKTTNWAGAVTTGNIIVASITNGTTWVDKVNIFVYNPVTGKYFAQFAVANTTDT
jgi:hypothetical protein